MDESRKRRIMSGLIIGGVAACLIVLAKRTPRDQWGETAGRMAKDALGLVRTGYGDSEPLRLIEAGLNRFIDRSRPA